VAAAASIIVPRRSALTSGRFSVDLVLFMGVEAGNLRATALRSEIVQLLPMITRGSGAEPPLMSVRCGGRASN
jgi:hypothetical protein